MLQYGNVEMKSESKVSLKEDKAFYSFFKSLEHQPTTIRLFRHPSTGVYSIHGEEARIVCFEWKKTYKLLQEWDFTDSSGSTPKKGKAEVSSSNQDLNKTHYYMTIKDEGLDIEEVLKTMLFEYNAKVEIWEKDKSSGNWLLTKKGSAGNIEPLESMFHFSASEVFTRCSIIMAYKAQGSQAGVAIANTISRSLQIIQFTDDVYLSTFEAVAVASGAKECIIPASYANNAKLLSTLEKCVISVSHKKASDFGKQSVEQDIKRLIGENDPFANELGFQDLQSQALGALISHLELLNDENNFNNFTLKPLVLSQYLRLDSSALSSLHLVPFKGNLKSNQHLYGVLNKTRTAIGARNLMQWIRQPLVDIDQINERHELVQTFVQDQALRQKLHGSALKHHIPDLERLAKKIFSQKANLEDCYKLYLFVKNALQNIHTALKYAEHSVVLKNRFTTPIAELRESLDRYEELIETVMDLEAAESNDFIIKAEFDPDLQEIHNKKIRYHSQIKKAYEVIVDDLGMVKSAAHSLEYEKKIGWFVSLKKNDKLEINEAKYHYVDDSSGRKSKGKTRIRNQVLEKLSDKFVKAINDYEERSQKIIQETLIVMSKKQRPPLLSEQLFAMIRESYLDDIQFATELVSSLDILVGFAELACNSVYPYCRPEMQGSCECIILKESRHPCLELQDDITFIPNDVELSHHSKFLIVTGPNMGGKSTFIRQIGMIQVMAQLGAFVPCRSAKISIVDSLMTRIGANDFQLRGISTFMAEMLEISNIIRCASKRSLVLIDELGRGTSTYDGYGLAHSISEQLTDKACFCLFATHFHELTELEQKNDIVSNVHVDANLIENELVLLHKVVPGPATESFGVKVAETTDFPKLVIRFAKKKVQELEHFSNSDKMVTHQEKQESPSLVKEIEDSTKFVESFSQLNLDSAPPSQILSSLQSELIKYKLDQIFQ